MILFIRRLYLFTKQPLTSRLLLLPKYWNQAAISIHYMVSLAKISVKVPAWVKILCTELFFNPCNNHENFRKNKEDGFCIDCVESFCCNCLSSHAHHKHLKIRRYVYCEVINRQDLSKFFDCSGIQGIYHWCPGFGKLSCF